MMHWTENLKKKPDGFGRTKPNDQGRQLARVMEQREDRNPMVDAKPATRRAGRTAPSIHSLNRPMDDPVVSVCLITYNHQPYIRECLDSLLMQETEFPFEICLGEDDSSDGTREICMEYAAKYSGKINLLLNSQLESGREDYFSQGVYNYIKTTKACCGQYIAFCDGDDTWIDPHKLQKQYEVMEAHPEISLVHSDYDKLNLVTGHKTSCCNATRGISEAVNPDRNKLMCEVIVGEYTIISSTAFARTRDVIDIFEQNPELFDDLPMGDIQTWCELLMYGSYFYITDSLSLYRVMKESTSNSLSAERKFRFVNGTADLGFMLGEKYNLPMKGLRCHKIKQCNRYSLMSGDLSELNKLHRVYPDDFSGKELVLYKIIQIPYLRILMRGLFQFRYRINSIKYD